MELDRIIIKGARQHNLKNVTVEIPKKKFVVFTGVSGSGKSSLAFDTLYAEGQRRYVESLSAYARQFLGQMEKPLYDHIRGIAPTISVEQKAASKNPRSTVATITEVHDYLRVLYARIGSLHCWQCGRKVEAQSAQEIVDRVAKIPSGTKFQMLAPVVQNRKGEFKDLLEQVRRDGFSRVRLNGKVVQVDEPIELDKKRKHTLEIVVDRLVAGQAEKPRLTEAVETALRFGKGNLIVAPETGDEVLMSEHRTCAACGLSFPELSPQLFSFNSPLGMCADCNGLGTRLEMDERLVVPDASLSVRDGAIKPWGRLDDKSGAWGTDLIFAVSREYSIDLARPFKDLPAEHREILLYGTGGKRVKVSWQGKHGSGTFAFQFEGVLNRMMRRMQESQSERAKAWYAQFLSQRVCSTCHGTRLRKEAGGVRVGALTLSELCSLTIERAHATLGDLPLEGNQKIIGKELLKEIRGRLKFLLDVGLGYLTLDRLAPSLSGGESQRIRLASQIGSELTGVIYILDEPSIGLHQRDNGRLIAALQRLRDIGNSILVVEHDEETMREADWLVDFGPGAGVHGGRIVEEGPPAQVVARNRSLTARYLSGEATIPVPEARRPGNGRFIEVVGATENNLKCVDVRFPLGRFVAVTGVSGAGKSTLVNQILYPALARLLYKSAVTTGAHKEIRGWQVIDKMVDIDQSPIGRTPRSNPSTYTKVFDPIRDFFTLLPESKLRGFKPGRFSFNVKGGRCEACQGGGLKLVEMHFLPDVYVPCEVCQGRRFNEATLEVKYKGKSIADILDMTVTEAIELFKHHPQIARILQTLEDVGLGYIHLGQSSTTLSGGEAQRIKLSRELAKRGTGNTLYILDEPTTGLHFEDVKRLLQVLSRLVDAGNTVVVIEHNLDVIKCADHVIDLGPEGGEGGGRILAEGTPEEVSRAAGSHTGRYLARILGGRGASGPRPHPGRTRSRAGAR